jgi:hypothetical protein
MFDPSSRLRFVLAGLACGLLAASVNTSAEQDVVKLFAEDRPYVAVPESAFDKLGWPLPDGGASVKALADAAPGGAFDPRKLEALPARKLGYQAKWEVIRYKVYGLDWDITGLKLTPNHPLAGMPTVFFVHGSDANWYEFFVDQFNHPGLGQYLAQKVPVVLVTIPGNFKYGGWTERNYQKRIPPYVLDREISPKEAEVRNAIFTFRVVSDGVRMLVEKSTSGPVIIVGHSTAGDIPFMLANSSLQSRMNGLFLGWGSGGPASMKLSAAAETERRAKRIEERFAEGQRISDLGYRPKSADEDSNYRHIGPLNPCPGKTPEGVDRCWARQEDRRRAYFQQVLQVYEHLGGDGLRDKVAKHIRETVAGTQLGINPDEVVADLFSTMRTPLTGYRKMLWLVGRLDYSHWNKDNPENAAEVKVANEFRKQNPQAAIRVAYFDVPITHYGHVERPMQLAGGFVAALRWLFEGQ